MITPYVSIVQLKSRLGITDNTQDVLLNDLLSDSYWAINIAIGVDSLNETITTEKFSFSDIRSNWQIYVRNFPVKALTHINGTEYAGVLEMDYTIQRRRELWIDDLSTYTGNSNFPFFTITYKAWYSRSKTDMDGQDSLPNEIKLLQLKLCIHEYRLIEAKWFSSYQLWDEKITFNYSNAMSDPSIILVLSKYKKANVI